MRLRTFIAKSMPDAIEMVREQLGDDAVILTTLPLPGGKGVKITAAADDAEEPVVKPAARILPKNEQSQKLRAELQEILRFHNVPEQFLSKIMLKATDSTLAGALAMHRIGGHTETHQLHRLTLEKILCAYFVFEPLAFTSGNKALMLVGPPGIGKTLTIAKIAAKLAMDKKPLLVITTDNKRAGGIEQLQAFTDILGVTLGTASSRAELYKLMQAAPKHARILIDTAGCNPYDGAQIGELEAYTTLDTIEPVLVLPAGGDSLESIDIVDNFAQLPIKKLLVTRADTARRFGGLLAAAATHGLAFCNASSSPGVADSLEPIDGAHLAELLLRYREYNEEARVITGTGSYDR